jgi:hypothetical protein
VCLAPKYDEQRLSSGPKAISIQVDLFGKKSLSPVSPYRPRGIMVGKRNMKMKGMASYLNHANQNSFMPSFSGNQISTDKQADSRDLGSKVMGPFSEKI